MDWKQFFASIISSIAWPSVVLAIVWFFYPQLKHLLEQIKKFGAAGVNVEISERVEAVRDQAEKVEVEQAEISPAESSDEITLDPATLQLAKTFPEAAVLQAYKELEGVVLQIRARLPDDKPHRNLNEVLKYLFDQKFISASVVTLFQRLREARNTVAHTSDEKITTGEALELVRQCKLLITLLWSITGQLPNPRT